MAEENNSDIASPSTPAEQASTPLAAAPAQNAPAVPQLVGQPGAVATPPEPKKPRRKYLVIVIICLVVLLFAGSVYEAYRLGKGHPVVITVTPTAKPLNLPPQAVVAADCVIGRGKQYILPKDIPAGPIYDVVNDKVIALEYSLNVTSIQSNPEYLSEAILRLTRDYPVDHFSVAPVTPKQGQPVSDFHIIMFIVPKDEAAKITCKNGPA